MAAVVVTGQVELARMLRALEGPIPRKITRSAMTKALRIITKSIKSEIPPQWKEIKKFIGHRFNKNKGGANKGEYSAKSGVSVGKKAGGGGTKVKLSSGKTLTLKKQRGKRPGVGLSAANVHWFILGTKQRRQGTTTKGRGAKAKTVATGGKIRRTGRMPAQVPNAVKQGFQKAQSEAMRVLAQALKEGIEREAAKVAK